jgi:hypothetical protein
MSRSGYSDDLDQWDLTQWRGQVASAIRGARGQAFLRELLVALDAMPEKRLIAHELVGEDGDAVCALGCIGAHRNLEIEKLDTEDHEGLSRAFNIAHQLVQEIEFENDEGAFHETPETRWTRMRAWVESQLAGRAGRELT